MARHPTRPGHKHTHVYGPLRKVQRMTARYMLIQTVTDLMKDDERTVDEACEFAGINIMTYLRAIGDVK